ncbi:MAG: hypothetical protein KDJ47_11740 [Hyphomicrobiaceae bacterium]|nr:hypothetical protein [Hyphomicrobiaceae bacterium]
MHPSSPTQVLNAAVLLVLALRRPTTAVRPVLPGRQAFAAANRVAVAAAVAASSAVLELVPQQEAAQRALALARLALANPRVRDAPAFAGHKPEAWGARPTVEQEAAPDAAVRVAVRRRADKRSPAADRLAPQADMLLAVARRLLAAPELLRPDAGLWRRAPGSA